LKEGWRLKREDMDGFTRFLSVKNIISDRPCVNTLKNMPLIDANKLGTVEAISIRTYIIVAGFLDLGECTLTVAYSNVSTRFGI
jgi:hypothetical protein